MVFPPYWMNFYATKKYATQMIVRSALKQSWQVTCFVWGL